MAYSLVSIAATPAADVTSPVTLSCPALTQTSGTSISFTVCSYLPPLSLLEPH